MGKKVLGPMQGVISKVRDPLFFYCTENMLPLPLHVGSVEAVTREHGFLRCIDQEAERPAAFKVRW